MLRAVVLVLVCISHPSLVHCEFDSSVEPKSAGQISSEALSLLRGAVSEREKITSLHADLILEYLQDGRAVRFHVLVDQDGKKRRVEHLADSSVSEDFLIDDDTVHGFRRKPNQDLEIYGIERSAAVRGDVAFDPRIIGTSDLPSTAGSVRQTFWIDDCESAKMLADEVVSGVLCRKVNATREGVSSTFWIDDKTFRLYRRRLDYSGGTIDIVSQFGQSSGALPVSVLATRKDSGPERIMKIVVNSITINAPIDSSRFSFSSFQLPVNTMINDYRISRIIGYWDGQAVVKDPVTTRYDKPISDKHKDSHPTVPNPRSRLWILVCNAVVLLVLFLFYRLKRS